jgi:hypothetical protein
LKYYPPKKKKKKTTFSNFLEKKVALTECLVCFLG